MYFFVYTRGCNSKSLASTMTEKEAEDVNQCIRIVFIRITMSLIWFTIQEVIQITLN